jgi:hypothetical protein
MLIITVDSLLSKTNMKGFPVVSADGSLTLVGWIDRSEIRYVLGWFADFCARMLIGISFRTSSEEEREVGKHTLFVHCSAPRSR